MERAGYTIMGWLNGLTSSAITHARVSPDYACWRNASTGVGAGCARGMSDNYWNFNVGPPTLLSWALGMYPYVLTVALQLQLQLSVCERQQTLEL